MPDRSQLVRPFSFDSVTGLRRTFIASEGVSHIVEEIVDERHHVAAYDMRMAAPERYGKGFLTKIGSVPLTARTMKELMQLDMSDEKEVFAWLSRPENQPFKARSNL